MNNKRYFFSILLFWSSFGMAQLNSRFPDDNTVESNHVYTGVSVVVDELPIKPTRTINFKTDEGSYMNLDVSPDGKTLIFDLLGDIYTLPVSGGKTTQITRGMVLNYKPIWSPDGTKFAYLCDQTGSFKVHVRDIEGKFHRVVADTRWGMFTTLLYEGKDDISWSSNGLFVNGRAISGGDLLFLDSLPKPKWGDTEKVQEKKRSAVSRDGHYAVNIVDTNGNKGLMISDLKTGNKKLVVPALLINPQYDVKGFSDPVKRFSISPDSKYAYISYGGKIHRITLENGKNELIPFEAEVNVDMGALNYNTFRVNHDDVKSAQIRSADLSPDGKKVVYAALNKIYIRDLLTGTSLLLTKQNANQHQPAFSPDGKWIAYVTWNDNTGGALWRIPANGGKPEQLTKDTGLFQRPAWSPDGHSIAFISDRAVLPTGANHDYGYRDFPAKLSIIDVSTRNIKTIGDDRIHQENQLCFSPDGNDIIYRPRREAIGDRMNDTTVALISKSIKENKEKEIVKFYKHSHKEIFFKQASVSPDNKYIAFTSWENIYLMPLDATRLPIYLDYNLMGQAVVKVSDGVDPRWEDGGKVLSWTYGNKYYRIKTEKIIEACGNKPKTKEYWQLLHQDDYLSVDIKPEVVDLSVTMPSLYGKGSVAFTNARLLTMEGDRIIEKGTIVITNGRIASIGDNSDIEIPKGIKVIDLKGATIMPGIVDVHCHQRLPPDIYPQQDWRYLIHLAYGVTTALDPASTYQSFDYADLLRTGQMIGSRLYTVGEAMNIPHIGAMTTADMVKDLVNKRVQMGGKTVKQYAFPSRLQRQWLIQACREAGLNMTNEGFNPQLEHLGMLKDGTTGIEHNPRWGDAFGDIIQLYAKCGSYLTPALQWAYGAGDEHVSEMLNQKYWDSNSLKIRRYMPARMIKNRFKYAGLPSSKSLMDSLTKSFLMPSTLNAKMKHAGAHIVMGSHGDDPGIGAHNEIWALQMGGLTNMEALQMATMESARAIGIQEDVGSLKEGKIADLIILNENPLDNIFNSREIRYVMKDGILYDGDTLDEIWPKKKKLDDWNLNIKK